MVKSLACVRELGRIQHLPAGQKFFVRAQVAPGRDRLLNNFLRGIRNNHKQVPAYLTLSGSVVQPPSGR